MPRGPSSLQPSNGFTDVGLRQKEWARRTREKLIALLGGKCVWCGAVENLSFDCILPQGPDHHRRMDWSGRMSFYRAQNDSGNLQILCVSCNSKKGDSVTDAAQPEMNWEHLGNLKPF